MRDFIDFILPSLIVLGIGLLAWHTMGLAVTVIAMLSVVIGSQARGS